MGALYCVRARPRPRWAVTGGAILGTLGGRLAAHEFRGRRAADGVPTQAASSAYAADLALARDAVAGRNGARREFALRMQCVPRFLHTINTRLGRAFSDTELEDLNQETLVEIWRRLESFAGYATLETWAYRFCQQVLSSRLRTNRRRPPSIELDTTAHEADGARSSLDYEQLYAALDRLDAEAAAIVRQHHFDQLTFEEIGTRISRPASTTKVVYQRAMTRLREILGPIRRESGL